MRRVATSNLVATVVVVAHLMFGIPQYGADPSASQTPPVQDSGGSGSEIRSVRIQIIQKECKTATVPVLEATSRLVGLSVADRSTIARRAAQTIALPFTEVSQRILRSAGARLVLSGSERAEAILRVRVCAEAVGREYSDRRLHYTDAGLGGSVSLETPVGITIFESDFAAYERLPSAVFLEPSCCLSPRQAPFEEIFWRGGSFPTALVKVASQVWGGHVARSAARSPDSRIRLAAAGALAFQQDSEDIALLITLLKDADWEVRVMATASVGKRKIEIAVPPLVAALHENNPMAGRNWRIGQTVSDLRIAAYWALSEIGTKEAGVALLGFLRRHLNDPKKANNEWMDTECVQMVQGILRSRDEGVRENLAKMLTATPPSRCRRLAAEAWDRKVEPR